MILRIGVVSHRDVVLDMLILTDWLARFGIDHKLHHAELLILHLSDLQELLLLHEGILDVEHMVDSVPLIILLVFLKLDSRVLVLYFKNQ